MAENKSDRPYLSLWEILCLIAFGIPEETGGSQWSRKQPGFMNRVPKNPVADHLAEAHSKVIDEETRRFFSARRPLEQEMRRGTINPRGLHPHKAIQTVIPLADRTNLVIDPIGGFDETGELHPKRITFNDQHTWQCLLFPSDEAFALWPPAGQETKPQIDRRPTDQLPTKAEPVELPEHAQPERGPSAIRLNRRSREPGAGRKSWTQPRAAYWRNRATEILEERATSHFSLRRVAKKIAGEDAPDHLSDNEKADWKRKGWTTENILRRIKDRPQSPTSTKKMGQLPPG